MKSARLVLRILTLALIAAAAVCAIAAYWDKLMELFYAAADRLEERRAARGAPDYADSADFDDWDPIPSSFEP